MDNELMRNEQDDQSFLQRRGNNARSRQKTAPDQVPDTVNSATNPTQPSNDGTRKKQIPSFEEIIAEQQEVMNDPLADTTAEIDCDDKKSDDVQIDPLESLKELRFAISKTQAQLSSEEIDSLLEVQEADRDEEEYENDENYSTEDSNEVSVETEDEMDALASLKGAIAQAQSQLQEDDLNDDDQINSASYHIGSAGDDQIHITPKSEEKKPDYHIPSFEVTEKILTEQRKTAAERRTKRSENRQKSDLSDITGILGDVVRADRKAMSHPSESWATGTNNDAETFEDSQAPSLLSDTKDRYTPAVYSILRGEGDLTQIQHMIIADIVARDLAEQCPQFNSQISA